MPHPSPEDLLARLTREIDTNVRQLHTNRLYTRPPVQTSRWRYFAVNFAVPFLVCLVLILVIVWLGSVRVAA